MNDLNKLLDSLANDTLLHSVSRPALYEQAHKLLGEQLMSPDFASVLDQFHTKVDALPRKQYNRIGQTAVQSIQDKAAKLHPAMMRHEDTFLAIAKSIQSQLNDLCGGIYLDSHKVPKIREIEPRLRDWFVHAYSNLVPSVIAQCIKARPHPELTSMSFGAMVNIVHIVVQASLGRPMDTTNKKYLFRETGDFDVHKNPTLWAVVNAACDAMELAEQSDYFIDFSEALMPWLCKIETRVYHILFGGTKELEVVYAQNA